MSSKSETKRASGTADRALIAASTPAQKRAISRGRTVGHSGRRVAPEPFSLRQRAMYPDENHEAGDALYQARTSGVLRGIEESADLRNQSRKVSRAMGRENMRNRSALGIHMQSNTGGPTTPHFITRRIGDAVRHDVSDLTKTSQGAPTKRRGREAAKKNRRLKSPSKGGRRTRKRKSRRKRRSRKMKGGACGCANSFLIGGRRRRSRKSRRTRRKR